MRKRKRIALLFFLSVFFLLNAFNSATAQNRNSSHGLNKYEIAIDLQNLFSDGYPDKVLFKINRIKENQIKGAYRFGIDARYDFFKREGRYEDVDYELWQKSIKKKLGITCGYEKQNRFNDLVLYYGVDIETTLSIQDEMEDQSGDETFYSIGATPFVGVTITLANHISTSFEAGLQNFFYYDKVEVGTNNNFTKDHLFNSSIKFPYSLTINYDF